MTKSAMLRFHKLPSSVPRENHGKQKTEKPKKSPTFLMNIETEDTEISLLSAIAFSSGFLRFFLF